MTETLAEMHGRHAREIAAIEKPGAPTYSQLVAEVERLRALNPGGISTAALAEVTEQLQAARDEARTEVLRLKSTLALERGDEFVEQEQSRAKRAAALEVAGFEGHPGCDGKFNPRRDGTCRCCGMPDDWTCRCEP